MKINKLCTRSVEFRAAAANDDAPVGDGRTLEGYAAVFNSPTRIDSWEGTFDEDISPGAFRKTLTEQKPVLQFDHGHDARTGSVPIGAFQELREDDQGLYTRARLFDNPVVEPIRQAIEGGAVTGMSFRFKVMRDEWRDKDGQPVASQDLGRLLYQPGDRGPLKRTIKEVQLFEAGPVVFPAYADTSVGVRSADVTEADREALLAEYQRTMAEPEEVRAAEPVAPEPVVVAPAEPVAPAPPTPVDDAATRGTSQAVNTPEDAALSGTSSGNANDNVRAQPEPRKVEPKVKTKEELLARAAEIAERLAAIGDESRDAALEDDTQTEYDGLIAERTAALAAVEKIEARQAELKAMAAEPKNVERGNTNGAVAPAFHQKTDIYDVADLRARSYSGEDFVQKVGENALRAIEAAKFGVRNKEAAQEYVADLLENVETENGDLAKRMLLTGSPVYERAFGKALKYGSLDMLDPEERQVLVRAQALGTDSAGGFAVPFQLDPTVILTNAGVVNPIRQMARVEQIVGKTWQGVTSAGVTVTRGAEGATAPDNSFTLAQPTLSTNRVQGFVPFNIEIDLAWGALRSEITKVLVDAKGREEDSFITGDGTSTNPSGVVATLSGNTVTAGGTAAFAAADVYNLEAALDPRWEAGASWLGHKSIYHKIRQFDTAGGAQFWASIGDGRPPRLLDYPDYRSSAMDNVLTTGKKILLFGDFSQFLIVDRIGMNVELIPHLFDASNSNRPTGQRGVYAVWMNNSKILVHSAFKLLVTG